MNDIDLSNVCSEKVESWTPIGYAENDFKISDSPTVSVKYIKIYKSIFDGDKKKISNLKINNLNATNTLGLFGAVENGTIKNCFLDNIDITGNRTVGAIVGYCSNTSISSCKTEGRMKGLYGVGGILGRGIGTSDARITLANVYNKGNISNASDFSILVNGNRNNNMTPYDEKLVMPSVYSVVNPPNNEVFTIEGSNENAPKLKSIE